MYFTAPMPNLASDRRSQPVLRLQRHTAAKGTFPGRCRRPRGARAAGAVSTRCTGLDASIEPSRTTNGAAIVELRQQNGAFTALSNMATDNGEDGARGGIQAHPHSQSENPREIAPVASGSRPLEVLARSETRPCTTARSVKPVPSSSARRAENFGQNLIFGTTVSHNSR